MDSKTLDDLLSRDTLSPVSLRAMSPELALETYKIMQVVMRDSPYMTTGTIDLMREFVFIAGSDDVLLLMMQDLVRAGVTTIDIDMVHVLLYHSFTVVNQLFNYSAFTLRDLHAVFIRNITAKRVMSSLLPIEHLLIHGELGGDGKITDSNAMDDFLKVLLECFDHITPENMNNRVDGDMDSLNNMIYDQYVDIFTMVSEHYGRENPVVLTGAIDRYCNWGSDKVVLSRTFRSTMQASKVVGYLSMPDEGFSEFLDMVNNADNTDMFNLLTGIAELMGVDQRFVEAIAFALEFLDEDGDDDEDGDGEF